MKRTNLLLLAACLLVCAGSVGAQYLSQSWTGVRIGNPQDLSSGTEIKVLDIAELSFTGDTTGTATVDVGTAYRVVGVAWKTCSADPGLTTAAVSGGTLTVTTASATTGTCNVAVVGL